MEKSIYSQEYKLFLEILRNARHKAGLSQGDIATKLGVTQSFISKCERGERRLDIVELRSWSGALRVSVRELVERFDIACSEHKNSLTARTRY